VTPRRRHIGAGSKRIVIGAIVKTRTIQALQPENLTHKWEFCALHVAFWIGIPKFAIDASNHDRQDDGNESAGDKRPPRISVGCRARAFDRPSRGLRHFYGP
jgi:hypothetical protein